MPEGDARPPGVPGLRRRGRRRTAVPCPRDSGRARPGSRIPPDNLTVIATKFGLVPGRVAGAHRLGLRHPRHHRSAVLVLARRLGRPSTRPVSRWGRWTHLPQRPRRVPRPCNVFVSHRVLLVVKSASEGEFEAFVRANAAGLSQLARLLSADPAAAEDLAQATLLRAWRSWPRVRAAG